jgi:hypothetical protein
LHRTKSPRKQYNIVKFGPMISQEKLANFIKILNIPFHHGAADFFEKGNKNWYHYLYDLNIISESEYNNIIFDNGGLKDNRFLRSFLNEFNKYFDLKDSEKKENIIDLGCGWGFLSFWIAQFKGKNIIGIGYPGQIEFLEKVKAIAEKEGLLSKSGQLRFVASPLKKESEIFHESIESDSIGKLILNDVIEHFHPDLYPALCKCSWNALGRNGVFISKSHNANNKGVLERLRSYWNKCESDYLVQMREDFFNEQVPSIGSLKAKILATNTRGFTREACLNALKEFKTSGTIPNTDPDAVPIDISLDNYMLENKVNPWFFKDLFEKNHFQVRLKPGIHGSRRYSVFAPLLTLIPELMLRLQYFSSIVIIEAKKNSKW